MNNTPKGTAILDRLKPILAEGESLPAVSGRATWRQQSNRHPSGARPWGKYAVGRICRTLPLLRRLLPLLPDLLLFRHSGIRHPGRRNYNAAA